MIEYYKANEEKILRFGMNGVFCTVYSFQQEPEISNGIHKMWQIIFGSHAHLSHFIEISMKYFDCF